MHTRVEEPGRRRQPGGWQSFCLVSRGEHRVRLLRLITSVGTTARLRQHGPIRTLETGLHSGCRRVTSCFQADAYTSS